jgi:signal transduction histidine kinase
MPDGLCLRIQDDGTGIPEGVGHNGIGLRIMQYRAAEIGGVLDIGPAPGGGTLVSCAVPRRTAHVE